MSALATHPRPTKPAPAGPPPLPAKTEPAPGGMRRLPGVVLFNVGWHRNEDGEIKYYGPDYIRAVAANFADLLASPDPHLEPPAVLGHEADQSRLKAMLGTDHAFQQFAASPPTAQGLPSRTDVPAAGWPRNLRFDAASGELVGDLEFIPPSVAELIETGQVRYPSVEVYHEFSYGGKDYGPVLRRVGLLGGTPPGNKAIPPMGHSRFADGFGRYSVFADGGSMAATKDDPLVLLLAKEFPDLPADFLAGCSADQLKQLAVAAVAEEDAEGLDDGTGADVGGAGMADGGVPAGFDKAKCVQEILAAEAPADPAAREAELGAMADADLYALWQKVTGQGGSSNMSDANKTPRRGAGAGVAEVVRQVESRLEAKFAEQSQELDRRQKAIRDEAEAARKQQEERYAEEKKARIDAFCESRLKAGKIKSRELDEDDPKVAYRSLRQRMYRMDAKTPVSCFSDGGTVVKKTELDIAMEEIDDRPVDRFGEQMGGRPSAPTDEEAQLKAAVKKHSDRYFAGRGGRAKAGQN